MGFHRGHFWTFLSRNYAHLTWNERFIKIHITVLARLLVLLCQKNKLETTGVKPLFKRNGRSDGQSIYLLAILEHCFQNIRKNSIY